VTGKTDNHSHHQRRTTMRVQDILRSKGPNIIMISARAPIIEASRVISAERIGVLIVVNPHGAPIGLLSERDIVCFIAKKGAEALAARVEAAMSPLSPIASPQDPVTDVMRVMTEQRARHIPVMSVGRLVGVISIGDILKSRLAEKDQEAAVLRDVARTTLAAA
jgi:CBS domain-containing protein